MFQVKRTRAIKQNVKHLLIPLFAGPVVEHNRYLTIS